ncbi:MAG: terminase TerL endonuclease subunit, partial [Methylocystis sp.]
ETLTLDRLIEESDGVVIGSDVGGSEDLFSVCILGRRTDAEGRKHWSAINRSFFYRSSLNRRLSVKSSLDDFVRAGELRLIGEAQEAYQDIVDIVRRIQDAGKLCALGVDAERPGDLAEVLTDVVDVDSMVFGIRQGWRLTGALQTLERMLEEGRFKHQKSALMRWCLGNAKIVAHGASARSVAKQVESGGKIDAFMSLLTAASLMATNPEPKGYAYADGRGLFIIG